MSEETTGVAFGPEGDGISPPAISLALGEKDEAKKQFTRASALGLSTVEKAALARWMPTGA